MQNHPQLLRRPLPPKFPKLPLYKKKVHTAKTDKIEPPHEKFAQDEITLIGGDKTSFPDVVSRKQLQTSVNIQNISLHYQVQRRVAAMLTPYRSSKNVYWSIPETAAGSIIFPSWPSASRRIFGKERKQMERSRKPLISNFKAFLSEYMLSHIKSRKRDEAMTNIIRGEGFNIIDVTKYETIAAMANLAVVNCQIHGRNALNLKGFFILNCPDLTSLASQLIYLNLSFNDISSFPTEIFCLKYLEILILRNNPINEIPSEIQQLKFLRVFNISFNLIMTLPPGLFSLSHLEELDISYNSIASIPQEIQKLRSLKKLVVDGNDLTSFPSGILKLNLKKILFENTFTHPCLWKENSLNSPQRLVQLTSLFFLKNNLHTYYDVIPVEIQMLLNCTSRCEWCQGPKFGEGYHVIQSCNVFGAIHLPVMFHVCSSSCYSEVIEKSFV
ncbi:leucine-rich repeat-containing protein 63 [Molossus nigricans]